MMNEFLLNNKVALIAGGGTGIGLGIAKSFNIPVLPHYYKDYDVPLLCTFQNSVGEESFDWVDSLIDNLMIIKDGFAYSHEQNGCFFYLSITN